MEYMVQERENKRGLWSAAKPVQLWFKALFVELSWSVKEIKSNCRFRLLPFYGRGAVSNFNRSHRLPFAEQHREWEVQGLLNCSAIEKGEWEGRKEWHLVFEKITWSVTIFPWKAFLMVLNVIIHGNVKDRYFLNKSKNFLVIPQDPLGLFLAPGSEFYLEAC